MSNQSNNAVKAELIAAELSTRMRCAILNTRPDDRLDGQDRQQTIGALIDRRLVATDRIDHKVYPLTALGRDVRAVLERRAGL